MHRTYRHDEMLFRVLRDGVSRDLTRRQIVERLRALRASGSAAIDLFIGVLDVD